MSDDFDPTAGIIVYSDYSAMTKIPTIDFNSTTGSIIFNNPIVPSVGITGVSAGSTLVFSQTAQFQNYVNSFGDYTQVPPTAIPDNPGYVYLPAIASGGVLQTTDILVCNSTISQFYCGSFKTHFYTDVTIDGNIINTSLSNIINNISSLSNQLTNIQLTPGPQGITGATGLQGPQGVTGSTGLHGGSGCDRGNRLAGGSRGNRGNRLAGGSGGNWSNRSIKC